MPGELWAKAAEVPDARNTKRSAAVAARSIMRGIRRRESDKGRGRSRAASASWIGGLVCHGSTIVVTVVPAIVPVVTVTVENVVRNVGSLGVADGATRHQADRARH